MHPRQFWPHKRMRVVSGAAAGDLELCPGRDRELGILIPKGTATTVSNPVVANVASRYRVELARRVAWRRADLRWYDHPVFPLQQTIRPLSGRAALPSTPDETKRNLLDLTARCRH
jgi:hypothetical protein